MTQCSLCKNQDVADVITSGNVAFYKREPHIRYTLLYEPKNKSMHFHPRILANHIWLMWSCEIDSFRRSSLLGFNKKASTERRWLGSFLCCCWSGTWCSDIKCPSLSSVGSSSLLLFIHLLAAAFISHLNWSPRCQLCPSYCPVAGWRTLDPGETQSTSWCCWLDFCSVFTAETFWAAGGKEYNK